eukprot:g54725.t1
MKIALFYIKDNCVIVVPIVVEEVAWEEGASAEVLLTLSRGEEQPATGRSEVSVQASEGMHSRPPDGTPEQARSSRRIRVDMHLAPSAKLLKLIHGDGLVARLRPWPIRSTCWEDALSADTSTPWRSTCLEEDTSTQWRHLTRRPSAGRRWPPWPGKDTVLKQPC